MKYLSVLAAFLLVFFLTASIARADYTQTLSDYNFRYSNYRQAYSKYTVAKSTYITYKTLTAQNAAVAAMRDTLSSRNAVVSAYFDLLQEKLNNTPGVDPVDLSTYVGVRKSTKEWLVGNQGKINGSTTIQDLNTASNEFEQRYPKMSLDMKQAIGRVLLAKGTFLDNQVQNMFDQTEAVSRFISQGGEDSSFIDRGLIQSRIKRDLFTDKHTAEKDYFFPKDAGYTDGSRVQLLKGQQIAIEGNQYLREAVSYLLEIMKTITGE